MGKVMVKFTFDPGHEQPKVFTEWDEQDFMALFDAMISAGIEPSDAKDVMEELKIKRAYEKG